MVIDTYNKATGELTLTTSFNYYHWGAPNPPTASDFGGVDMRGEVILLTRNIQIEGEDLDDWGCTIVTT